MYKVLGKKFYIENVNLDKIKDIYDRPVHIYSNAKLRRNLDRFECNRFEFYYAVKANDNGVLLGLIKRRIGFEVVSYGEIIKLLKIKVDPGKILFSGVGKSLFEIVGAISVGVSKFNVESVQEFIRICRVCKNLHSYVFVILRINLDINCNTHGGLSTGLKESKFGVNLGEVTEIIQIQRRYDGYVKIFGIGFHLGSQISDGKFYVDAIRKLNEIRMLYFKDICVLNFGGGVGIDYEIDDQEKNVKGILKRIYVETEKIKGVKFYFEPGRSLISDTCVTLFKVEYIKRNYVITDLGMNNIIRPALYNSFHKIINTERGGSKGTRCNIVGPICECSDFLVKNYKIDVSQGDFLLMLNTGAYCYSMSSDYNSRPKALELLVSKSKVRMI